MANTSSAKKAMRSSARKQTINRLVKTKVRTVVKNARAAIKKKDESVKDVVLRATKELDKAASKKILHKRTVARLKSRIAKQANKAEKH